MKRQARRNVTSVTVIYKCLAVESRDVGITYKWDKSGTLYNQFHYFAKPKCTKNHVKKSTRFHLGPIWHHESKVLYKEMAGRSNNIFGIQQQRISIKWRDNLESSELSINAIIFNKEIYSSHFSNWLMMINSLCLSEMF